MNSLKVTADQSRRTSADPPWTVPHKLFPLRLVHHWLCLGLQDLPTSSSRRPVGRPKILQQTGMYSIITSYVLTIWADSKKSPITGIITNLLYYNNVSILQVYQFAFWLITSAYIFLGLFTSCICCFSIVVVMLKGDH